MQYKLTPFENVIVKIDESGMEYFVPNDPANADWQEYQAWLAADPENQPLPAE